MVYQLGQLKFEPINAPNSFTKEEAVNLVEQPRLVGLPTLQSVGGVLTTISLGMSFRKEFINVRQAVNDLKYAMIAKESMALINGNGYPEGEYVIEKISTDIRRTSLQGEMDYAQVIVQLKQYVSPDPDDAEDIAARRAGFANISANPITVQPTVKFQTPQALVMRDVVTGNSAGNTGSATVKNAFVAGAKSGKYLAQAKRALANAKKATQAAKAGVDGITDKISNAAALKASMDSVISSIDTVANQITSGTLPEPTLSSMRQASLILDQNLGIMMSTASELTNVIIARK